jgi:hypothetical protein
MISQSFGNYEIPNRFNLISINISESGNPGTT